MAARTTTCFDCGAAVSLIDGLPVVRGGIVGVVCRECPPQHEALRDLEPDDDAIDYDSAPPAFDDEIEEPPVVAVEVRQRRRESARWLIPAVAALAVVGLTGYLKAASAPRTSALNVSIDEPEPRLGRIVAPAPEPPVTHALTYSLTDEQAELPWVHPIAGDVRELPDKDDRRFGADRPGHRPDECGGGHCGVDLGEERGTVIHAALGGRVIRVKHDPDGASGRYVAIEHPQGLRSSYMHLDAVHPELVVGIEIASGEAIGTLGRSGIHHSPAHLHFTVQRKTDSGWQYVDPLPMLTQATVLEAPAPMPLPAPPIDLTVNLPAPPAPHTSKAASEDPRK